MRGYDTGCEIVALQARCDELKAALLLVERELALCRADLDRVTDQRQQTAAHTRELLDLLATVRTRCLAAPLPGAVPPDGGTARYAEFDRGYITGRHSAFGEVWAMIKAPEESES